MTRFLHPTVRAGVTGSDGVVGRQSPAADARLGHQCDQVERYGGRGDTGDLGVVIRRGHLDDVAADNVEPVKAPQKVK